jgi:hypothetical protein
MILQIGSDQVTVMPQKKSPRKRTRFQGKKITRNIAQILQGREETDSTISLRKALEKIANVVGKSVVRILRNISMDCGKAARNKTE